MNSLTGTWYDILKWMEQTCETCGCLLNNAPECDPEINDDTGCAHYRKSMCEERDRTNYYPGGNANVRRVP